MAIAQTGDEHITPSERPTTSAPPPWSVRMADSVLRRDPVTCTRWHYEHGLMLKALEQVWLANGDDRYWRYIKETVDQFVDDAGGIRTYSVTEYNLDQINPGKNLFTLYRLTGDERYRKALYLLREQLKGQPRTSEGGFWHKLIYPFQMWLDGIYMAAPFYAEFGRTFDEPAAFDDVAHQIILIEKHTRDPRTGLLYHGWDESRQQRWANPETGCSPHFWGRAMGWYAMALVDVLDHFPENHTARVRIIEILANVTAAVARVQDMATGVWYQILDLAGRLGNYPEASGSCMFVYSIAKAVRKGYLQASWLDVARRGFRGILDNFVAVGDDGLVSLHRICSAAGLGGTPYRDGSYEYYIGEKIVTNDYKGVGPFILAALEMERLTTPQG